MHRTQAHPERLAGTLASLVSSPDISWFKGRQPVSAWNRAMVSTDGRVLLIEQAQLSDAGSYRCVASNVVGSAEMQYSLRVNGELPRLRGSVPRAAAHPFVPVCSSISHPSILPFFRPPPIFHPSSIHPSIIHASFHLSFPPSIYHLSVHPSIHPSISSSIYTWKHPTVHPLI